jgi:hypothetical protein
MLKELGKLPQELETEKQAFEAARQKAMEAVKIKGGKILVEPIKVADQKYLVFDDGATGRVIPA